MKVAIVGGTGVPISELTVAAQDAGHTVLGVTVTNFETDLSMVKAFDPDLLFIDHDLGLPDGQNGRLFVVRLGIAREKCIGLCASRPQPYCAKQVEEAAEL